MSDQAVILTKGQLDPSYTYFLNHAPIMLFSPFANFGNYPLNLRVIEFENMSLNWLSIKLPTIFCPPLWTPTVEVNTK